ncbi:MAG: hypothetical protein RL023_795 [Candidatus Parcubacteria bacterium]|jgi:hypothetical protein
MTHISDISRTRTMNFQYIDETIVFEKNENNQNKELQVPNYYSLSKS